MARRLWIVRHGDRFDYDVGEDLWKSIAQRLLDPPLSDAGRMQAQEVAMELHAASSRNINGQVIPITKIVTSPFLRCIETANPIANRLGLPLLVDHSLFEVGHTDCPMPSLQERAAYFPRIDINYESIFKPELLEPFPVASLSRGSKAAEKLTERFEDDCCVLVTHAATAVAIVASLLKVPIREINSASPCSLFCLDRDSRDSMKSAWRLSDAYNGSIAHLSKIGATTAWPRRDEIDPHSGSNKFLNAGDSAPWI